MKSEGSWFSRLLFRNAATGVGRSATTSDEILAEIMGRLARTASGASVTPDSAMAVAAVFACVRLLADSVAMLPLRLYKDTGLSSTLFPEHPIDRLMRRPNPVHTAFEFRRYMMACLLLRGNAYFLRHMKGTRLEELLPLHPALVEPKLIGTKIFYEYTPDGTTKRIYPADLMLHVRALSTDGIKGISVIGAAREAIGLAMTTEKHGAKLFANGTQIGGHFSHPQTLSAEAAKRLKASIDEAHSGVSNAHRTMLLEEGMKFEKVGMTGEESQFLESRKFQRSEIAMFFGVAPHLIGDVERGTSWGSGIEQQGIGFVLYSLLPWLTNIEQAGDRDLLTPDESDVLSLKFDTDLLTRADFITRQTGREIQLRNGVISPNEWRRGERMNPRTDAGGDEYAKPGATSAAAAAAVAPAAPAAPKGVVKNAA